MRCLPVWLRLKSRTKYEKDCRQVVLIEFLEHPELIFQYLPRAPNLHRSLLLNRLVIFLGQMTFYPWVPSPPSASVGEALFCMKILSANDRMLNNFSSKFVKTVMPPSVNPSFLSSTSPVLRSVLKSYKRLNAASSKKPIKVSMSMAHN